MTIYDYSDLLKMIANINTDKIIAKNERTMNNKNRLAKMENKLLTCGILNDWYDLKKSCKRLNVRLAPYGNWDEETQGPLMKDQNGKYFMNNGTFSICMSSGSHWSDHFGFSYYDKEQKKIVGFDIDLLDKISDYLGFEYKLYPLSMKQIEQKIKNKEINLAIAGISITDERQRDYSFTDIYYETYLQIVVNKNADITDRKDVKNMAIGVVEGTSSEEYAKEYLAEDGNKIKVYKTAEEVFENLEADKIEATIYDAPGIQSYMNTHKDTTNLEVLDEQLNSEESNYGIMFAKGYKYLDQFNVALQVLNNDGSYQKIKEQWIKTKE